MNQITTALLIFNLLIISSSMSIRNIFDETMDSTFTSPRDELCEIAASNSKKSCPFGINEGMWSLCGGLIVCRQGPGEECDQISKQCHPKSQCVDGRCTGCITLMIEGNRKKFCPPSRHHDS